jgi:hypothetical protein
MPQGGRSSRGIALREKFHIEVTKDGLLLRDENRISMSFSAVEALMLLDILKHEETTLRRMADEASPLPVRIPMQKE